MAAFTALRRLALKGEDHETERMAFKGEMRSLRALKLQELWSLKGLLQLPYSLFSLAYDALADFGSSFARPISLLVLLLYFMAVVYQHESQHPLGQQPNNCGEPVAHLLVPGTQAWMLSSYSGLPFIASGKREPVLKAYHCLFGKKNNAPKEFVLPDWFGIWSMLHTFFSAILIFFILLALRNRFKIK